MTSAAAAKSLQSCLTLCHPMDCSPPGSSVQGIFQARVLEWGATKFLYFPSVTNLKEKIGLNYMPFNKEVHTCVEIC